MEKNEINSLNNSQNRCSHHSMLYIDGSDGDSFINKVVFSTFYDNIDSVGATIVFQEIRANQLKMTNIIKMTRKEIVAPYSLLEEPLI